MPAISLNGSILNYNFVNTLELFLNEHPTLDKLFGKALSAAITVLVVVFSPLLYLLVLVMRALFCFDLYRV